MRTRTRLVCAFAATLLAGFPSAQSPRVSQVSAPNSDVARLVVSLEEALQSGDLAMFRALVATESVPGFGRFETLLAGPRTRAAIRERDRIPRDDGSVDLLLDAFIERGPEGHISAWRATVTSVPGGWRFSSLTDLSSVDGLHRLTMGSQAFDARDLRLTGTDFSLHMRSGVAFTAGAAGGATALVLHGKGDMVFTPPDPAERRQVEIFGGGQALRVPFDAAFVRLNPSELGARLGGAALVPRDASSDERRRAQSVFDAFVHKTYGLDLHDLSPERWSLVPQGGDLVAEVHTGRHGDLTYARSAGEAEDVSLFQRATRRNISVYASPQQLEARGRFYSEDDLVDYDVEQYDVDVRVTPAHDWIEGMATLRTRVRRGPVATVMLRLAESLTARSVVAKGHGRLMHLRVLGQSKIIITMPAPVATGDIIELEIRYGGRLPPQALDREVMTVAADQDMPIITPEPRWIYSNRSYWYPQSTVTDFATARLRITVPHPLDVVASGTRIGTPEPVPATPPAPPARAFTFETAKPARYLAFVVSRFVSGASQSMPGETPATLNVAASPRQAARSRATADLAARIFSYYRSVLGAAPYPQLTIAISESDLPGGHSPAYLVLLNQIPPATPITWRADPVSFEEYPAFFLAHEIAHQWWGQAVGWKSYHDQWISEGFAQYFAMLYAGEQRGPETLGGMMRQMRRWAVDESPQGPISLGYRLGHIQNDSRVFRALVYNKSAVVLHMLRRLVGDEPFFAGLRRFYQSATFGKAGTDDFRRIMEAETGRSLERFFERWIYGFGIPTIKTAHRVETLPGGETELVLRAEQAGPIYDLPVTFRIDYATGASRDIVLLLTGPSAELRVPLDAGAGRVRRVVADSDAAALARFIR